MKKTFFILGIILLITALFISCTTVSNAPPYTYTGDQPLYPAIWDAVKSGNVTYWKNAEFELNSSGTMNIHHVYASDLLKMADFSIGISLVNNVVTYRFYNIKEKAPIGDADEWAAVDDFNQQSVKLIFTSYLNEQLLKIMEDANLYAQAKSDADAALEL